MNNHGFFRKRPIVIEAWRIPLRDEEPSEEILELVQSQNWDGDSEGIVVTAEEGDDHLGSPGDWIIKGVEGEFYVCPASVFEKTYDETEKPK